MHSTKNLQKNSGRNFMFECIGANEREMVNAGSFKPNRFKAGMTGSLALRRRNGQMEPDENGYIQILSQSRSLFFETFVFRPNPSIVFNRNYPDILILVDWVEARD